MQVSASKMAAPSQWQQRKTGWNSKKCSGDPDISDDMHNILPDARHRWPWDMGQKIIIVKKVSANIAISN